MVISRAPAGQRLAASASNGGHASLCVLCSGGGKYRDILLDRRRPIVFAAGRVSRSHRET